MKCNTCRNLCKRRDEDGTLYDWCGKVIDSPVKDLERYCPYYHLATNADRIRNMDDYDLAIFLENVSCKHADTESWFDWLKQEVKE